MGILLEVILSALFGIAAMYAFLKVAITTRPKRETNKKRKAWKYFIIVAMLFGAIMSGWLLLEVVIYLI